MQPIEFLLDSGLTPIEMVQGVFTLGVVGQIAQVKFATGMEITPVEYTSSFLKAP